MINEYQDYDAIGLKELVDNGDVSATELLETAISLAEEKNPAINAIVTPMFEKARTEKAKEGPLGGVPFLIKDLAFVKDIPCTFGSRLWRDFVPDHDAEIVKRYRQAGLVIFGKTNTPEVGLACTTEPVLYGATKNPWDTERTPGGSSGGAAAAVAAGILPVAHATDGGGSIRIPASCCGLVGLKPTRARTPLGPDAGEGWGSMATAHVVSRSVRDTALLLDVSHGPAAGDPYHAPHFAGSYLEQMQKAPGQLRIAIDPLPVNGRRMHPEVDKALQVTAKLCESLGHQVEQKCFDYDREMLGLATSSLVISNVRNNVLRRAEAIGVQPDETNIEAYTAFLIALAEGISGETYARSINMIHAVSRQLETFFSEYDLILSPTLLQPPPLLGYMDTNSSDFETYNEHFNDFWGFTNLYNATGHPAISLPLAWSSDELPIGMQFVAPFGREDVLMQVSHQLEQAQPWFHRRPS